MMAIENPSFGRDRVRLFVTRVSHHKIVHDAMALYGVQLCRKLLPLIIVPFLARTLGPSGWGLVAFMQSLAEFLVLVIEFGFNLSGTREIARHQDNPQICGQVMSGVLSAQALLAIVGTAVAAIVAYTIPILHAHPALVVAGLCYAIAQGFAPLWFFQGLERMKLSASLEIAGKIVAFSCIIFFVRSADDSWKVLMFQAVAPAITSTAGLLLAFKAIPCLSPRFEFMRDAFRHGWPMFLFRSGESLYGVGNAFVLGLFVAPVYVGYFAGADKITRAAFGLLLPIREVLFPRLSNLAAKSRERAEKLARSGVMLMTAGGVTLGLVQWFCAPMLVRLLMGKGFDPAISVLRIEAIFPVLLSLTYSVGLQWLIPLGRDAVVNRVIISAGVINLTLATILAPRFAHIGMAWSVISAEAFVCISFVAIVWRTQPFWGKSKTSDREVPELVEH